MAQANGKGNGGGGRPAVDPLTAEERKLLKPVLNQAEVRISIPLNKLNIDWSYQDRPRATMVNVISTYFHQVLLGVLIVSERPDGTYWVCDGATRKLGIEKMGDPNKKVLCQVLQTSGQKIEALLFKYYNASRKQVPLSNRLHAEGIAGVDGGLQKVLDLCGYTLVGGNKKRNVLRGPYFIREAHELDGGDSLQKALFAIRAEWGERFKLHGNVVLAVAAMYFSQKPKSVDAQVRKVLRKKTPADFELELAKAWAGGPKVGAKMRPDDRPRFLTKALGRFINSSRTDPKVDLGLVDDFYAR